MHDITISKLTEPGGQSPAPVAIVRNGSLAEGEGEDSIVQLSISHDGDYATATCLAYDPWTEDTSTRS